MRVCVCACVWGFLVCVFICFVFSRVVAVVWGRRGSFGVVGVVGLLCCADVVCVFVCFVVCRVVAVVRSSRGRSGRRR